ncbi:hypothetical protein Tco_1427185, partial [Tanacetum coccineum]
SLSEYDEEIVLRFNDLFNIIHPDDSKSKKDNDDNDIGFGYENEDGVFWRGAAGVHESCLEETIWDPSTFGLHIEQEMVEAEFGAYWAGSDRLIPNKGDLRDY